MKTIITKLFANFFILFFFTQITWAQVSSNSELYVSLKEMDSIIFEVGFNNCLLKNLDSIISDDLEFYHDQGGLSETKAIFFEQLEKNICSNWDYKPIRKLKKGSMEVYPMNANGELYGAIQKGIHEFYIKEVDKPMYKTSIAKFTHVWIIENNQWKIKRVLSYDHQPANNLKYATESISLSNEILALYVGTYKNLEFSATISKDDKTLIMNSDKIQLTIIPRTENMFFSEEAPLTFEFVYGNEKEIVKMIVRENGTIVDELQKI